MRSMKPNRSAIRRLKAPCGILASRSTMPLRSPRKLRSELPRQSGPALPRTRGGPFVPGGDPCAVANCAYGLREDTDDPLLSSEKWGAAPTGVQPQLAPFLSITVKPCASNNGRALVLVT